MKRKKRFYLTLIELMVVIVLIGMISSVIAYNVQGSITKGKEMKTQQAAERLKEVIALESLPCWYKASTILLVIFFIAKVVACFFQIVFVLNFFLRFLTVE